MCVRHVLVRASKGEKASTLAACGSAVCVLLLFLFAKRELRGNFNFSHIFHHFMFFFIIIISLSLYFFFLIPFFNQPRADCCVCE